MSGEGVSHTYTSPCAALNPPGVKDMSSNKEVKINVDEILVKYVGECGIWQWGVVLLSVLSSPSMATFPVFVNAVPDHRCKMENPVERLFKDYNLSFSEAAAVIGPWKDEVPITQMGCSRFALDWNNTNLVEKLLLNKSAISVNDRKSLPTEECVHGYVYASKRFQYPSTVVEEFNLICENNILSPLGTSLFLVGMLFGFILGGYVGDKFGRRRGAIGFSLLEILSAVGVSLAPNHHIYHLMRTIVGFSSTGKAIVLRVLPIELTVAKYRSYFTSFIILGVVFAHRAVMSGLAYSVQDWRLLNTFCMLPCLTCFTFFYLLPESPRWLLSQCRDQDAVKVLRTGCRINHIFTKDKSKLSYFDTLLQSTPKSDNYNKKKCVLREPVNFSKRCINILKSMRNSFNNTQLVKTLVICVLLFITHSLAFFGVLLYGKYINDNIYIVTLINASTAIPGPIIASIAYRCFKYRRIPLMSTYMISGLSLFIGGIYTVLWKPLTDTVLNICCNFALVTYSASMIMMLIYCAELFPSYMRTRGVGISSGLGRIGGIISTFVNYTDFYLGHGTPVLIYSGSAIFQVILLCCLRDTSGEDLPDVELSMDSKTDDNVLSTIKTFNNENERKEEQNREECIIDCKT
ncbi:unnamed protein product [Trichobilharzia regenti]|uniref:MFS domain-containing protein n=1 Tax=Trichobilharzia regenti TaxID=157069 RepID=A0A183VXM6_TRIRE|nr:unnamed protein product [Trichobilharzia regenti]VDQ01112.1 unnamed protein product [Trichobilharzia regenti]